MKRTTLWLILFAALVCCQSGVYAHSHKHDMAPVVQQGGPPNSVILIIRHAEKPDDGPELAPSGQERARAYVHYFETYKLNGAPLHFDDLFASRDSTGSMRPRLTLEPLSHALGMPLQTPYKDKDVDDMAAELRAICPGKHILICWHHGEIADLLASLGANPNQFIPGGDWPSDQYGWVIQLCFDHNGNIIQSQSRRIVEGLQIH
jgi:hypothetical protein